MNIRTLISAAILSTFALGAWAQTETPRVDQRQAKQQARIAQGAASGSLTKRETRRLEREQLAVANAKGAAQADGVDPGREEKAHAHAKPRQQRHSQPKARRANAACHSAQRLRGVGLQRQRQRIQGVARCAGDLGGQRNGLFQRQFAQQHSQRVLRRSRQFVVDV